MIFAAGVALAALASGPLTMDAVEVDRLGVLRWKSTGAEASFFGANYCLPSALDFRAVKASGADPKAVVRGDMLHFARMGWNAIRLSFWGDWENSDPEGSLVDNEHLDLLCYVVQEAERRGIYALLSPIVTYDSRWPEMKDDPAIAGFSKTISKARLGTDPHALAVQQNYIRQLLRHRNPYTGRALKDEPSILFLETINEPWHHSSDRALSLRYINGMVEAVRSETDRILTFHNLSQDFGMAPAIQDSAADGSTISWYPTGLNANHTLQGGHLSFVDQYRPWNPVAWPRKPLLVYEFDMPDVGEASAFPAMARSFRSLGAQYAAMFSYDMIATAPQNLGWTTHLLNLVYTPRKAMSGVIAAEAMKLLPRGADYGEAPGNRKFGPFRVSQEEDLAELVTDTEFLYSNTTKTRPPSPGKLTRVAGAGSSPLVRTDGNGACFLDRLKPGVWRLEAYPSVVEVADPYHSPAKDRLALRLMPGLVTFEIRLPDLGMEFEARGLSQGLGPSVSARKGRVSLKPGAWLLVRRGADASRLPESTGRVGLREYSCPEAPSLPDQVRPVPVLEGAVGMPLTLSAWAACGKKPKRVEILAEQGGRSGRFAMSLAEPYRWQGSIPASWVGPGEVRWRAAVIHEDGATTLEPPSGAPGLAVKTAAPGDPLVLFLPSRDAADLSVARDSEARLIPADPDKGTGLGSQAAALAVPSWQRRAPDEITACLVVRGLVQARAGLLKPDRLRIWARGLHVPTELTLTLVDVDGYAWSASVPAPTEGAQASVLLASFLPSDWRMVPQGFPGSISDRSAPRSRTPALNIDKLERLEFSVRGLRQSKEPLDRLGAAIGAVELARG